MKIYAAKTLNTINVNNVLDLLDEDRQKKVLKYKNHDEKIRSIYAGLLFRHAYIDFGHTKEQWSGIEIEYNQYGKPSIKDDREFNYSLSHSGDWVVCAVDINNIGIDIQKWQNWKMNLAKRFFSEEEYQRINMAAEEEKDRLFFSMWAGKESYVKYTGRGIGSGIDKCILNPEMNKILAEDKEFNVKMYDLLEGYSLCLCSKSEEFPDEIEIVKFDEI